MKTSKVALTLICLALLAGITMAQVPGDGIPDLYEVVPGGETFLTSAGEITREVGDLVIDTDGNDMVALLVEGPNFVIDEPDNPGTPPPDNGNYLTGATAFLPDPDGGPPLNASNWTIGYIQGLNQWIRTNPLDTDGFVGVIGEYEAGDPFAIFPDSGLTTVGGAAEGTLIGGNVIFETSEMGGFSTADGTMGAVAPSVPEPATMSLFGLALLGLIGLRRR